MRKDFVLVEINAGVTRDRVVGRSHAILERDVVRSDETVPAVTNFGRIAPG